MYMNRFIVGAVVGMGIGALAVWYTLSPDKNKKCLLKKSKKWAKRAANVY